MHAQQRREQLIREGRNPDQPLWFLLLSEPVTNGIRATWRLEACVATTLDLSDDLMREYLNPMQWAGGNRHYTSLLIERQIDTFERAISEAQTRPLPPTGGTSFARE